MSRDPSASADFSVHGSLRVRGAFFPSTFQSLNSLTHYNFYNTYTNNNIFVEIFTFTPRGNAARCFLVNAHRVRATQNLQLHGRWAILTVRILRARVESIIPVAVLSLHPPRHSSRCDVWWLILNAWLVKVSLIHLRCTPTCLFNAPLI